MCFALNTALGVRLGWAIAAGIGWAFLIMGIDRMLVVSMTAKHGARNIRPGGSIVFTSGTAGARPGPGWAVAASILSAMEGLTRGLAMELAPVRVNIVAAGVVKTPMWRDMPEAAREALYASEAKRLPVGHVAEPAEIAQGYLYLMRQTYVTGQTLYIDGALSDLVCHGEVVECRPLRLKHGVVHQQAVGKDDGFRPSTRLFVEQLHTVDLNPGHPQPPAARD